MLLRAFETTNVNKEGSIIAKCFIRVVKDQLYKIDTKAQRDARNL